MDNISTFIDHSLLKPDASEENIINLCKEAATYNFHAVCINPCFVKTASNILADTEVKTATVVGFPLGTSKNRVKTYEAVESVIDGAEELDIVMNIHAAKTGRWHMVEKEITDIITSTPSALHKIIIETCFLSDDEKRNACRAVINSGAEFIKTSTGFGSGGAVLSDIELIRTETEGRIGIKASGGIKTFAEAAAFIRAGATRIGTSSGVSIVKEAKRDRK